MTLLTQICSTLDDLKAQDITILDVTEQSDDFDSIVIATGTSSRHNNALFQNCIELIKKNHDIKPRHFEQDKENQWILIDYDGIVVHLLQQETRDYYKLEKLWAKECLESL